MQFYDSDKQFPTFGFGGKLRLGVDYSGAASHCFALNGNIFDPECDGLDGVMARLTVPTYLGAYLDIVFDFILYSAFILIFGLLDTGNIIISCLLLFSYICTGTTFLAQAIVQPKLDLIQKDEKLDIDIPKTFYYSAGLIEGAETILFMILCLLFPNLYFFFGLIFTILCLLTALSRILIFYKRNKSY